jgi:hypothetical protein
MRCPHHHAPLRLSLLTLLWFCEYAHTRDGVTVSPWSTCTYVVPDER